MGIPQLNSFCCGCSLNTGTKIIGWLSLIGFIIMTVCMAHGLAGLYYIEEHPEAAGMDAAAIPKRIVFQKALGIWGILYFLFRSVLSFILLHGTYEGKANLILIWVKCYLAWAIIGMASTLIKFFILYDPQDIVSLIFSLVELYCTLVVYSFYREILSKVSTNYA